MFKKFKEEMETLTKNITDTQANINKQIIKNAALEAINEIITANLTFSILKSFAQAGSNNSQENLDALKEAETINNLLHNCTMGTINDQGRGLLKKLSENNDIKFTGEQLDVYNVCTSEQATQG